MGQVLDQKDERDVKEELCVDLDLKQVIDRNVGDLSGGELQRFAIAVVAIQNAEIYMFDEPSSYLDVKQRLKAAQVIRSLLRPNRFDFLLLLLVLKYFSMLLLRDKFPFLNIHVFLCILCYKVKVLSL